MLLVAAAADAVVDCWTRQAAAWHAGSSLPPGLSAQGGYLVKYEVEPELVCETKASARHLLLVLEGRFCLFLNLFAGLFFVGQEELERPEHLLRVLEKSLQTYAADQVDFPPAIVDYHPDELPLADDDDGNGDD